MKPADFVTDEVAAALRRRFRIWRNAVEQLHDLPPDDPSRATWERTADMADAAYQWYVRGIADAAKLQLDTLYRIAHSSEPTP